MLIGYNKKAKSVATEAVSCLLSIKPYLGFSIRGARRSGRSAFFAEVANHLNASDSAPINCFVGELEQTTPEGFEKSLLGAIRSSGLCRNDYSSFQGKVRRAEEFFELAATLYEQENRIPVFLIDMGGVLEYSLKDKSDLNNMADLSRLLKQIANLFEEKNINIILGIGLTFKFVHSVEGFFADVYIHRYPLKTTLKNTTLEGDPPCRGFQQIVKAISGLDISDEYSGLWRGDNIVTAGQLGENLASSGTNEVTSDSLWENLKGKWNMLGDIQVENIPISDLSNLILCDAVLPQNKYPNYLEPCEDGYRANDNLYEMFGFVSPRRDPGKTELIKRRIEDPDDQEIVADLLGKIRLHIERLGLTGVNAPQVVEQKSGFMDMQVYSIENESITGLEKELYETVFPRKLLVVIVLSSEPDETMIIEKLSEYRDVSQFILILYLEGIDLNRIPLGRYIKNNIKSAHSEAITIDELIKLFVDESGHVLEDVYKWVNESIFSLFDLKPPFCLGHNTVRQIVSGTISASSIHINELSNSIGISKTDLNKCLKLIIKPQIIDKTRESVSWDPENDYILNLLKDNYNDEQEIYRNISSHYVVDTVNIEEVAELYQCITGAQGLKGLTDENILTHEKQNQEYWLKEIEQLLDQDNELDTTYRETLETYQNRELSSIEDIRPYRKDISNLLNNVRKTKASLEEKRKNAQEELRKKKEELKEEIKVLKEFFTKDDEINNLREKIDKLESLETDDLKQIESKVNERRKKKNEFENDLNLFNERIENLYEYKNKEMYNSITINLNKLKEAIVQYRVQEIDEVKSEIERELQDLEKMKTQQSILKGGLQGAVSEETEPETQNDGPPDLGDIESSEDNNEQYVDEQGIDSTPPNGEGNGYFKENEESATNSASTSSSNSPTEAGKGENTPKIFDLSNFEDRKELALTLLNRKNDIKRIEIEVDE